MPEPFAAYDSAVLALGLLGLLYVVQLVVADVVGIRRRHTPGTPVAGGHEDLLFRVNRAHANTTESIGAVVLIAGFAMLRGGDAALVNGGAWTLLACRGVHTLAYYLDLRPLRSIAFGLGLVSLLVVFMAGLRA